MSPRSASVNEELRRRSRERLLQATVELVGERGYEATTLGDIADRAGSARGLVSYYFPGKRQLAAVRRAPADAPHAGRRRWSASRAREDGRERMARAIDAILGLARDQPVLMRHAHGGDPPGRGVHPVPRAAAAGRPAARHGGPVRLRRTPTPTTRCCAPC